MNDYLQFKSELYHHGIKGQKWGVRRYQNYDGTRTAAGQKRYSTQKTENDTQDSQIPKSSTDFKNLNPKTRALLIGGAIGLAAAGGMYAYAKISDKEYSAPEFTIKAGTPIYRVASGSTDKLRDWYYATPDKKDKTVYEYAFSLDPWNVLEGGNGYKYSKEYLAKTDLKIAGMKVAEETFKQMCESDGKFSKYIDELSKTHDMDFRDYKSFNTYAPMMKDQPEAFKTYVAELQRKGYSGVIDYKDKFGTGLKTNAPIIFFGGNENVSTKTVEQLNASKVQAKAAQYVKDFMGLNYVRAESAKVVSVGAAYCTILGLANTYGETRKAKKETNDD